MHISCASTATKLSRNIANKLDGVHLTGYLTVCQLHGSEESGGGCVAIHKKPGNCGMVSWPKNKIEAFCCFVSGHKLHCPQDSQKAITQFGPTRIDAHRNYSGTHSLMKCEREMGMNVELHL